MEYSREREEQYDEFRRGLVLLFSAKAMKICFQKYVRLGRGDRTKITKQEVKKSRKNRKYKSNPNRDYSLMIDTNTYPKDFENMDASRRIEELKTFGKHEHFIIEKLLENTNKTKLEIYAEKNYDSEKVFLSKIHLIQELMNEYFERTGNLEKREEEAENVSFLANDRSIEFFSLCGKIIPIDILRHILSFMEYSISLLNEVGSISSTFYITILKSWPHIKVRKKNVYIVSILALQNIRRLTLVIENNNENFKNSELDYIFSHIKPDRLHTVSIEATLDGNERLLRYFQYRRTDNTPTKNVKKLVFKCTSKFQYYNVDTHDLNVYKRNWESTDSSGISRPVRLSKSFPQLEIVENTPGFGILEGLSDLKKLSVDFSIEHQLFTYKKVNHPLGNIGSPKRDFGINKKKITKLSVTVDSSNDNTIENLKYFLKGFQNVIFFNLECKGLSPTKTNRIDFGIFQSTLLSLRELEINDEISYSGVMNASPVSFPHTNYLEYGDQSVIFENLESFKITRPKHYVWNSNPVSLIPFFLSFPKLNFLSVVLRMNKGKEEEYHAMIFEKFSKRIRDFKYLELELYCICEDIDHRLASPFLDFKLTSKWNKRGKWEIFAQVSLIRNIALKEKDLKEYQLMLDFISELPKFMKGENVDDDIFCSMIEFQDGTTNRQLFSEFFRSKMASAGFENYTRKEGKLGWVNKSSILTFRKY